MYRSDLKKRDRGGAIIAVAAVHVALLFVLLHISGRMDIAHPDSVLRVFDIRDVPPPPPQPIQPQPQPKPKPKESEGAASPQNVRSNATDVQAPKPPFSLPVPVPMETSTTPNTGTRATQGASNPGPGTGAGGNGTGTGSGGAGNGTGGGGAAAYPARLLTPTLRGRDFPTALLRSAPRGARVDLGLRVEANGSVSECKVFRSSGVGALDSEVCNLAHSRFRFRPALNRSGQPVASWFGYSQANF
jgi:protein TonB